MKIIDSKNDTQLLQSIIAESAKAINEIKCANNDLAKAKNRLRFCVMLANTMLNRKLKGDE
jgi:hypothetical protein